jgi:predicted N-acetyltransferase YhbS
VVKSLVAVDKNELKIVGHILFSSLLLKPTSTPISPISTPISTPNSTPNSVKVASLAPLSVLPSYQKKGIGKDLVKSGLEECKKEGYLLFYILFFTY